MNKTTPLVTILMPVYNGERYLKEAIGSVLSQTYRDFEFIIINDGSTDATQSIIDTYEDQRIVTINQKNQGVARSLNKGLQVAKGKYILRHDADDKCLPEQLERQVAFLENHPEYALVSTQVAFMTDRGKIAWKFRQPNNAYFNHEEFVSVKREQFNPYSPITHATVLMNREVILKLGGYRSEFKTSEDTDLWLRLLENHKAAVLNRCTYFVRLNKSSATHRYKSGTNYYRDLAFACADERKEKGTDLIMRGEQFLPPPKSRVFQQTNNEGKNYRSDLLNFQYKVMVNAKDFPNILATIKYALKDGWKLRQTWKGILFPLLGDNLVQLGVKFKRRFRSL